MFFFQFLHAQNSHFPAWPLALIIELKMEMFQKKNQMPTNFYFDTLKKRIGDNHA